MCLAFLHRHEEALAQYDQAIAVRPTDARYYHNRAVTYTALGRAAAAAADLAMRDQIQNAMARA